MATKKKAKKEARTHVATIVAGVTGPSFYINDYRVAGPKPWGGGDIIHRFEFTADDLIGAGLSEGDPHG